jgi:bifunctional DNA-binding transcriptional regulator/antitoxin component of YhaV-PrlF toxin-antitoxin module
MSMQIVRLTRGGQVSVPAEIRHRWHTSTLTLEDHGDHVVLRPSERDPITAARGALKGLARHSGAEMLAEYREEEAELEDRRRHGR